MDQNYVWNGNSLGLITTISVVDIGSKICEKQKCAELDKHNDPIERPINIGPFTVMTSGTTFTGIALETTPDYMV